MPTPRDFVSTRFSLRDVVANSPVHAAEIFGLRLLIGLPVLGVVLLIKHVPLRFSSADVLPIALGGVIFTLHLLIQIAGLVTTTATNSGWMIWNKVKTLPG